VGDGGGIATGVCRRGAAAFSSSELCAVVMCSSATMSRGAIRENDGVPVESVVVS
jgi:hypothetical protein